jgi:GGDEF domain-containing protein
MANSLCECVKNYRFFWTNEKQNVFTIGISIGLVPISAPILNPKSVIAMADTACYIAKNTGCRCVYVY